MKDFEIIENVLGSGKVKLVFDFNGTLAVGGRTVNGVVERLNLLTDKYSVHVITADTFGTAASELTGIDIVFKTIESTAQDVRKAEYIMELNADECICFGNGRNDVLMLKDSLLGICVLEGEGAYNGAVLSSDITVRNITEGLDLILFPKRLKALLRN